MKLQSRGGSHENKGSASPPIRQTVGAPAARSVSMMLTAASAASFTRVIARGSSAAAYLKISGANLA